MCLEHDDQVSGPDGFANIDNPWNLFSFHDKTVDMGVDVRHVGTHFPQMYNKWLGDAGQALFPPIKKLTDLRDLEILLCIPPAKAVDIIGAYVEQNGIDRYYSWTVPPGYPIEQMDDHLALFAAEVIPHFRD